MCNCNEANTEVDFCGAIGCEPHPPLPESKLYRYTDPQTGEQCLVWGTRVEVKNVLGKPGLLEVGFAPFPTEDRSIGFLFPVLMPVRHFPMVVDNYDEWVTEEKGFVRVMEFADARNEVYKSKLILGVDRELELSAAGSLATYEGGASNDDGIRHLYYQKMSGSADILPRFVQGSQVTTKLIGFEAGDRGGYAMHNCRVIAGELVTHGGETVVMRGCIKYDVIPEAATYREAMDESRKKIDALNGSREAAVARQDFPTAALLRDQADDERKNIKRLQEGLCDLIYSRDKKEV